MSGIRMALAHALAIVAGVTWLAVCATCGGEGTSPGIGMDARSDGDDALGWRDADEVRDGRSDADPPLPDVRDAVAAADTFDSGGGPDVRRDAIDVGPEDVPEGAPDGRPDVPEVRPDARADVRDVAPDAVADAAPDGAADTATDTGADVRWPDYLTLCQQPCGCEGADWDPCPVSWGPQQIEWSEQATYPPPPGFPIGPDILLVRAGWRDGFADGGGCARGEPCGGHCLPSARKVYAFDVRQRTIRLVADEPLHDPHIPWPYPVPSETLHDNYVFRAPGYGVTLYVRRQARPAADEARDCLDFLGDSVRAIRVTLDDASSYWIDVPLVLGGS